MASPTSAFDSSVTTPSVSAFAWKSMMSSFFSATDTAGLFTCAQAVSEVRRQGRPHQSGAPSQRHLRLAQRGILDHAA